MSGSEGGTTVLRSLRVLAPTGVAPADVIVRDGRIAAIAGYGDGRGGEVVDLGDDVLMPALVDVHVHVNEPGRTEWEGFASATRAAAAGGIGLIVDMPLNSEPVTTSVDALEAKLGAARESALVDVACYGGVVPANADDPRTLVSLDRAGVAGFKAFLCDSGLSTFPPVSPDDLRRAMAHLAPLGRRLLVHAELFAGEPTFAGGARYADYLASRPPGVELRAIERLVDMARETGCPVHVVHLSSADALPLLEAARAAGLDLTVETCPHYLTFAAEEIAAGDTRLQCAPPIRGAANREALWAALGRGAIDFVATDHSPCPPAMKPAGEFGRAWGGIASLELLLPAVWTAARARGFGLERLEEWLARRPARWLGLDDRGELAVGSRADLVAWQPEATFVVRGEALHHRHPLTPYEGRELAGVVTGTWVAGSAVYRSGRCSGAPREPIRIRGGFAPDERTGAAALARLEASEARPLLAAACGSSAWVDALVAGWPYGSARSIFAAAEAGFDALAEADWREAFAAHPRIGDRVALRRRVEGAEQAGAAAADQATLAALAAGNAEYEARFGHVFLICASGKSAAEMLGELERRLAHDAATELAIAAGEQRKITRLRLSRLLAERSREGA
jgi:allantoinase